MSRSDRPEQNLASQKLREKMLESAKQMINELLLVRTELAQEPDIKENLEERLRLADLMDVVKKLIRMLEAEG